MGWITLGLTVLVFAVVGVFLALAGVVAGRRLERRAADRRQQLEALAQSQRQSDTPSDAAVAVSMLRGLTRELSVAGDALADAARYLKDDSRGYRASLAMQAALRAKKKAAELGVPEGAARG
jgi:uncharacterized membrane protein YhiD involved in acid resistance